MSTVIAPTKRALLQHDRKGDVAVLLYRLDPPALEFRGGEKVPAPYRVIVMSYETPESEKPLSYSTTHHTEAEIDPEVPILEQVSFTSLCDARERTPLDDDHRHLPYGSP